MHFESAKDETFYVLFKDILRIEKDPKSENSIKITLNRYLDSEFSLRTTDRNIVAARIYSNSRPRTYVIARPRICRHFAAAHSASAANRFYRLGSSVL